MKTTTKMKYSLLILISIFSIVGFGQNKSDLSLCFIDGYTNLPLSNHEITLAIGKNEKKQVITNENGVIILNNFKSKKLQLKAKSGDKKFYESYFKFKLKNYPDRKVNVYFYPTKTYEDLMFKIEDSIYGEVIYSDKSEDIDSLEPDSLGIEAQFPDGFQALSQFLSKNIIYPQISIELNDQGKCYLSFIVEKDGAISHVIIIRGVSKAIDMEAKRVIRSMPKWIPGTYDDAPVRTRCNIPINFILT